MIHIGGNTVPGNVNIKSDEIEKLVDGTITSFVNDNITTIMPYTFYNRQSLKTVSAANVVTIPERAFSVCSNLEDISFQNCKTIVSSSNSSTGVFVGSTKIKSLNLPSVEGIGNYAFYDVGGNSDGLSQINLPQCKAIGNYAFYGQKRNITAIILPECTSVGNYAFYQVQDSTSNSYRKLTTISIPKVKTVGSYAFYVRTPNMVNTNLWKTITLPECTSIGDYAFGSICKNATTITLPKCTSIGSNAFAGGLALVSMTLGASSVCALSATNGIPASSSQHITIYVPSDLISSYQTATNWNTLYNNGYITFQAITE